MFAATILASPDRADLSQEAVDHLAAHWNAVGVDWLDRGIACDLRLPRIPADAAEVGEALHAQGFDLVIQPAAGRRKAVLLADMDSTIIQQECIDELADLAGVGARVADITARAMNGEINFHEALIARVGLLAGLPVSTIAEVLATRITVAPGAGTLVATMRANGAWTALVSGGFTDFTGPVAARLGFDEHRANTLLTEGDVLSGHVALPVLGRAAKLEALHEIAAARGVASADVLAVGDGANDLDMIAAAGTGVALHAKPAVAAQAQVRVDHGDLTALLYLQGYGADEFVRP